jgi:hypothetical protein
VSLPTLEELERLLTVYRYYNSDKLSDVTIRYGAKREHTFYGHKIHLTTQSKYFEDLFNNTSKVSDHSDREYREAEMTDRAQNTEEIILEGDEPKMVKLMLKFAYGRELHYPTTAVSLENVLFAIYMFRIAAKYEFPEHEQMAVTGFVVWLNRLCAGASVEGEGPTLHESSTRSMRSLRTVDCGKVSSMSSRRIPRRASTGRTIRYPSVSRLLRKGSRSLRKIFAPSC